jgi:hypothetical protein
VSRSRGTFDDLFGWLGSLEPKRPPTPATCDYCRFARTVASPCGPQLECRRRAPANYPNVYHRGGTRFPWVSPGETCGEFQRLGDP